MAIHRGDNNQTQNQNTNQQPHTGATTGEGPSFTNQDFHQATGGQQQRQGKLGLNRIGERLGSSFRRGAIAEQSSAFREHLQNTIDSHGPPDLRMRTLILDAGRFGMHYSGIVIVGEKNISGRRVAMAFTGILEGSNTPPPTQQKTIGNQQVNITLTPMDAWDELTWKWVEQTVQEHLGQDTVTGCAGSMVIPAETDPQDGRAINDILATAEHAIRASFEQTFPKNFEHFDISEVFDRARDRMMAQFTYNDADADDPVGNPLRSDIRMTVVSSERNQAQDPMATSMFQHQSSKHIAELTGFVDLLYSPEQPQQQMAYGMPMQQQQMPRLFLPQVVITGINSLDVRLTPETFLLSIAVSQMLNNNYAWAQQFTNFGQDQAHDIGGIGYRMPNPQDPSQTGVEIDTKSNDFDLNDLYDLVKRTCQPYPAYSIDCEDAGPNSWLTGILIDMAYGSNDAAESLIKSADHLTGGRFTRYWQGGYIVVPKTIDDNRVHLGTYEESGNQRRDIREVDTLAMLNFFGHSDLSQVQRWEWTFFDTSVPRPIRLDYRLRMLEHILGSNVRIRGMAERLTFDGQFLAALVQACQDAGLAVDMDGLHTNFGNQYHHGGTVLGQYASQANPNALFSPAGPTYGASRQPFQKPTINW